jgi:hypothetical protein
VEKNIKVARSANLSYQTGTSKATEKYKTSENKI